MIMWRILFIVVMTISGVVAINLLVARHHINKLRQELTNLLPTFDWPISHKTNDPYDLEIIFDSVPFYMELQAGLADNGIYAYNAITIWGIGEPNGIHFVRGQNVFKVWVEFQKFVALCKENGVKVLVNSNFEDDYKDLKKQIESLNNLRVIETNEKKSK